MMREFGSEFDNLPYPDNYFDNHCRKFINHEFTRSGREAISLVAKSILENKTNGQSIVLLPTYICHSMISAFKNKEWVIKYYLLNTDLSINKEDILAKIKLYNPICILIVNYFGCSPDYQIFNAIKEESKEVNIVYDVTHSLLSLSQIYYEKIDYYVASLRKWFGLSDGGLVLSNKFLNSDYVEIDDDSKFLELREIALSQKKLYLSNKDIKLKEQFKNNLKIAEIILDPNFIYRMSTKSLFKIRSLNILEIRKKRNINFLHLWNEIKSIDKIKLAIDSNQNKLENMSFMLPLLIENRDEMQAKFALKGLYSQVIWDIPNEAKICAKSEIFSRKILCIPIDQRYNYWDIEDIIEIIKTETSI